MLKKIQNNLIVIIICFILAVLGTKAIIEYCRDDNRYKEEYQKYYVMCKEDINANQNCEYHIKPYQERDAISTFGYIITVYDGIYVLQILAPLLIMIAAIWSFHKFLWKGYLVNSITRMDYTKLFKKIYFKALKYSFILPIFLLIIFIISIMISGNFDYEYGIKEYGFDAFGIENYKHWVIFMLVYFLNFILHSIFWINIVIYNAKHNKNVIIDIIVSYIEYIMIFIIFELIFGGIFFVNTDLFYYFSLSNIWSYTEVTLIGEVMFSTILVLISTLVVYLGYKNKEKILEEVMK